MPGVPSGKGCTACRKQKKKCDQAKPECGRCARVGIACVGSGERRWTFKEHAHSKALSAKRTNCKAARLDYGETKPGYINSGDAELIFQYPIGSQNIYHGRLPPTLYHHESALLIQPTYSRLSPQQVSYFDRFRNQIVFQVGGHPFDDFWFRTVLRESSRDDCVLQTILGIGALGQALESAPSDIPLYKVPISRQSNLHYLDAIAYFTSALARFRRRISSSGLEAAPRTVLISTILFSVFELLQGNSTSSDKLMLNGITILKDTIMLSTWPNRQSLIAAPYDDEGVEDAEFILMRRFSFKSMLLPLSTQERDVTSECALPYTEGPPPPSQKESFKQFWKLWMRFLALGLMWYLRAQRLSKEECHEQERPGLIQEQLGLISQLKAWESATEQKLTEEGDDYGRKMLKQIIPGVKTLQLHFNLALDDSDEANSQACETANEVLDQAESIYDETPLFQQGLGEVYESIQCISLGLSRICRGCNVRSRSSAIAKEVVNAHSRWDGKAILMGNLTLTALEETGRDDATGTIPLSARYDWVYSSWNDNYTELNVIFRAKASREGAHHEDVEERQMILRPEDFGLV